MSTFKVLTCKIKEIINHPNADRLEIVTLDGMDWQCVTQRDKYKSGDVVAYLPVESILSEKLENILFPPDSKVTLNNSRIKTIRLRGAISQGMVVNLELLDEHYDLPKNYLKPGTDLTKVLEITKYEPPVKGTPLTKGKATKKQCNPNFRKYTGIENAKNFNNIFQEGEEVVVTCKIHGTNFRCGWVKMEVDTIWKKILKFFNKLPEYEFVYGSHNVQLQDKLLYKGFYKTNVYAETVVKYGLRGILKPGQVVYGEIYGDGIQKGYNYDCLPGERKVIFFDVKLNDNWVDSIASKKWFEERNLPYVPVLYVGLFNKEKVLKMMEGASVLCPNQKIREGIVVKSIKEETCYIGRKILKYINDEYLLKNQDNESLAH